MVERKVEEQLKARGPRGGTGGERKIPLHDIAKELALDAERQLRVAEIADAAKRQIFDIARTPRADGTSIADELIDAMLKGDQKGAQQIFARLATETVPGTDATYLVAVSDVQKKALASFEQLLGPDAFTRFRHMGVKPDNIETGADPWAEYVRQRRPK